MNSLHDSALPPVANGLEIVGGFDGLTGLDELAPGMTWDELLAATWGLPCTHQPTDRPRKPELPSIGSIVRGWFSPALMLK